MHADDNRAPGCAAVITALRQRENMREYCQKMLQLLYCCSAPLAVLLFFPYVLEGYPALGNITVAIFSPPDNAGLLLFPRVHQLL